MTHDSAACYVICVLNSKFILIAFPLAPLSSNLLQSLTTHNEAHYGDNRTEVNILADLPKHGELDIQTNVGRKEANCYPLMTNRFLSVNNTAHKGYCMHQNPVYVSCGLVFQV